jgi:hypothetical protein
LFSIPSALALILAKPTLVSFAQNGTRPQRIASKLRSPAFASYRTTGSGSVGGTFQLGAMFGVGRSGGIEKTSLISLTLEEREHGHTRRDNTFVSGVQAGWTCRFGVAFFARNF